MKSASSVLLIVVIWTSLNACATRAEEVAPQLEHLKDEEALIEYLVKEGTAWVESERNRHRPHAHPLSADQRQAMAGFFSKQILDTTRIRRVAEIQNPEFFSIFRDAGEPYPIDFRRASGLSLLDTVLVTEERTRGGAGSWLGLLFHELVHVAQDRFLGPGRYMENYVRGWAENGRLYRSIPAEAQAYDLAARYRRNPMTTFSVEEEVRKRFRRTPQARDDPSDLP